MPGIVLAVGNWEIHKTVCAQGLHSGVQSDTNCDYNTLYKKVPWYSFKAVCEQKKKEEEEKRRLPRGVNLNVSYRVKWSLLGESVSGRDVQNHGRIPERGA